MENLHLYFTSFVNSVLHGVARWEYTIEVFLLLLSGLFFLGCVWTLRLSRRTHMAFTAASRIIKESAPEKENYGAFYNRFQEIGSEIEKQRDMEHGWREFAESTFDDKIKNIICLTARPQAYFNKASALSSIGNLKQIQAFPNNLIGLGLFFTFLGLAAALNVAQAGLGSADQSQQALHELLKTASIKFISSLVAVALSLILSFIQRGQFHKCGKVVDHFCCLIEERTVFMPAEKLMLESKSILDQQLVAQENMAFNISEKLGEMLAKSLPDSVAQALQPLADEIRSMAANLQKPNEHALKEALDTFIAQLRGNTGREMDALVSTVQTLKDGLEMLTVNIQKMGMNFGEDTRHSSTLLANTLQHFAETFQPVQQGMLHFGQTLQSLERISSQIEQAGGSIHGAAAANAESVTNLAHTVTGVSDQILPLQMAMEQLQLSLRTVADTSQMMQHAGRTIGEAADGFHHSANQIGATLQNFALTADRISDTAVLLNQASAHVSSAANPLAQASEGITQAASSIYQTEIRLQESQQVLRQMLEQIRALEGNMPRILSEYEKRFGKVDEDLSRAFSQLSEGSLQFQNAVADVVGRLDTSFEKALGTLSGSIQELAETQDSRYAKEAA